MRYSPVGRGLHHGLQSRRRWQFSQVLDSPLYHNGRCDSEPRNSESVQTRRSNAREARVGTRKNLTQRRGWESNRIDGHGSVCVRCAPCEPDGHRISPPRLRRTRHSGRARWADASDTRNSCAGTGFNRRVESIDLCAGNARAQCSQSTSKGAGPMWAGSMASTGETSD